MKRFPLPALTAAVVCLSLPMVAVAQNAAPPAAPGLTTTAPAKAAAPAGTDVVGSVYDTKVTWDDLFTYIQRTNPTEFDAFISQTLGPYVAGQLLGPNASPTVTITKDEAFQQLRSNPPPAMGEVLESLLERDMVETAAKRANIVITPAQVKAIVSERLAAMRKGGQIPPGVTDEQFLAQQHLTEAKLESLFKPVAELTALLDQHIAQLQGHPIGPSDFLQASHILIPVAALGPNPTAAAKQKDAEALAKIQTIRKEIVSGKMTFAAAAAKYGTDSTKAHGGDLGVFMRGMMTPSFDKAVFSLKKGVVSEPVRSHYGYHLILVTKLGDELTHDQRTTALRQRENLIIGQFNEELQKQAKLVNTLQKNMPAPPLQQDSN